MCTALETERTFVRTEEGGEFFSFQEKSLALCVIMH